MDLHQRHARVFKALCDPNRLEILELLRGGEKCACVLLEQLKVTQSGLSYHMKILCESGIVASRQEGKWTHYRLSSEGREAAIDLLRMLTTQDGESVGEGCTCRRERRPLQVACPSPADKKVLD